MPQRKLYPNEKTAALSIRLPASMKKVVEQLATEHRRSLNQEIVWLIQQALAQSEQPPTTGRSSR